MEERLRLCSKYMIQPGMKYFDDDKELYLEIGCGKGNFIIKKALDNPDKNFIAVEGQETVILRALEKTKELAETVANTCGDRQRPLSNLKFMLSFVHSMDNLFEEGQISGIYLNFCDPWPKARHAKRRLTYRGRLKDYVWALKEGGFVEFKTDNDDLYASALEEIGFSDFQIVEQTTDLHNSDYVSRFTTTEYEDKFSAAGEKINYIKIIKWEKM